jgi:hypothetical protein
MVSVMLLLLAGCAGISQSGTVSGSPPTTQSPGLNAIPLSFFGFIVNQQCSISDTAADGSPCNNLEPHSSPGLPLGWSRSLGPGQMKWSELAKCDPTGSVCPVPGSGCGKAGEGPNGLPCPSKQLVEGCVPNANAPDDPSNCAYVWGTFDFWTKLFNSHQIDWMYTAFYTPDYLSVRGSRCTGPGKADFGADPTCVGAADVCGGQWGFKWGCDPPADIDAVPGSGLADGTNQNFKWFATAFMKHLQQTGEHVEYWEAWNEPENCEEWNHRDQPNTNCPALNPGGGPSTGTYPQLLRLTQDARTIVGKSAPNVLFTSPAMVADGNAYQTYLPTILKSGGRLFDMIAFHGYYNSGPPGCPANCPVPEHWVKVWNGLTTAIATAGQPSKPVVDTEFNWGPRNNVIDPDMRAAHTARIYLLQESYYPTLSRVSWFGEDFPIASPGAPGQFWASGATNVQDHCTVPDPVQGGYDCPGGLAMRQVALWTTGATFSGPCTCSHSPNGGNCSAETPTGIWQCSVTRADGTSGLFVWDNTQTIFPCSNSPCGNTSFAVPAAYKSDWQDLDGNQTLLNGASTVTIGAKPILIENH